MNLAVFPLLLPMMELTLKALGGVFHPREVFWLITSEVESFSTRNFAAFQILNAELGKIKFFQNLLLGSRDMAIFGEQAA